MDRQWICIRGRKLLTTEFIHILDSYRCSSALSIRGDQVCKQYNAMICVLQELTSDYMEGKNYIGDQLSVFLNDVIWNFHQKGNYRRLWKNSLNS